MQFLSLFMKHVSMESLAMTIEKKLVTPEMAESWLEGPTKNRRVSEIRVQQYATKMISGEWQYNPADAICFDTTGRLINAQHRLWAVVESGEAQWFLVVTNVDPAAQDVMDQGYRRTVAHQLDIDSVPFPKETAAIARAHILWHQGRTLGDTIDRNVSVTEVREWVSQADEVSLVSSIEATGKIRRQYRFAVGPLGSVLYEAHTIDSASAKDFGSKLETGMGLTEKDPIYQLGKYMQRQTLHNRKLPTHHQLWLLISCWNHWRAGRAVGKIMSPSTFNSNSFGKLK